MDINGSEKDFYKAFVYAIHGKNLTSLEEEKGEGDEMEMEKKEATKTQASAQEESQVKVWILIGSSRTGNH